MVNIVLYSLCYAGGTLLLCRFGPSRNLIRDTHDAPHTLIRTEKSPKSNHSRTYAQVARKSNYSRTYAKQGVGVRYRNGNVAKICRRADIPVLHAAERDTQEPI